MWPRREVRHTDSPLQSVYTMPAGNQCGREESSANMIFRMHNVFTLQTGYQCGREESSAALIPLLYSVFMTRW